MAVASNQDDRSGTSEPLVVGHCRSDVMGCQCWGRGRCNTAMQYVGGIAGVACGPQAVQDDPAVTSASAQLLCPRSATHLRGPAQRGATAFGSLHPGTLA